MSTVALTKEQYTEIIQGICNGIGGKEKNIPIATALQIEANTGIRIGDVLNLKRGDIVRDGNRYRFDIKESKTKKARTFTVPDPVYRMIESYCDSHGIEYGQKLFHFGVRNVQKRLESITDFLGYKNICTHSFRKYFATKAYLNSGNDIELVSRLLQHSNSSITRRYIGIQDERMENVLQSSVSLI